MQTYKASNGGIVKAWTDGVQVESVAIDQLRNVASLPFIYKWVVACPDVHFGIGATIGSVIPTQKAIIPAAVGTDIGCGVLAAPTNLTANDLPDNLEGVRAEIEAMVPLNGGWPQDAPGAVETAWQGGSRERKVGLRAGFEEIMEKHSGMMRGDKPAGLKTAYSQLCSLGSGNHFIEVCLDERDKVWIMLHSGSRGIGNKIGTYFIEMAKKDMERWMIHLPDKDLAYFPTGTEHFHDYFSAVSWAQEYALVNRELIADRVFLAVQKALGRPIYYVPGSVISCHHNYVAQEQHYGKDVFVTRKGAVRAREGDLGIIPGSMGTKSYITIGLGNPESFMSSAHGAGRAMSRRAAKAAFTLEDHEVATAGIACRKDAGVLDETPMAYKPIENVMAAQTDLVRPLHTLRQVVCVKG